MVHMNKGYYLTKQNLSGLNMSVKVIFVDTAGIEPPELLKECKDMEEAHNYGYNKAKEYCQDGERPRVCYYADKRLILTPTDYAILLKEE